MFWLHLSFLPLMISELPGVYLKGILVSHLLIETCQLAHGCGTGRGVDLMLKAGMGGLVMGIIYTWTTSNLHMGVKR